MLWKELKQKFAFLFLSLCLSLCLSPCIWECCYTLFKVVKKGFTDSDTSANT